jgi:hypothetical protein
MADLATAMRATAEDARQTTVDRCKADAQTFVEQLHTRSDEQAKQSRKTADDDVATIREQSRTQVERIREETEHRIARRHELLEQDLQQYTAAVDAEIARVQEKVAAFEQEVASYFESLQDADPTTFAAMAAQMPSPPSFEELDTAALASELHARGEAEARAAAAEAHGIDEGTANEEELPAYWWLDSPKKLAEEAAEAAQEPPQT